MLYFNQRYSLYKKLKHIQVKQFQQKTNIIQESQNKQTTVDK